MARRKPKAGKVQGEADSVSARRLQQLERPRKASAHLGAGGEQSEAHRHTDRNLDEGLEETFPASDPVSISPGAD